VAKRHAALSEARRNRVKERRAVDQELIPIEKDDIQELQEFREFMSRRYKSPLRAWFALDSGKNMALGQQHFIRMCRQIGFTGNPKKVWRQVDQDASGTITLLELAPTAGHVLAELKHLVSRECGGSSAKFFDFLDSKNTRRVGLADFEAGLAKLRYTGLMCPREVFQLLDLSGLRMLRSGDLDFLEKWQLPPYLFEKPDVEGMKRLKNNLIHLFGSALKAWRKMFDRDDQLRIGWEAFRRGCAELQEVHDFFPKADEVPAIWKAMDEDCSDWVALREFDVGSWQMLVEFKRWAERTHDGVMKAFHKLCRGKDKLSLHDLKKAGRGPDPCRAPLDELFLGLDLGGDHYLQESDVRFLHKWQFNLEDWGPALTHG
jgi:hypothetical protein